MKKNYNNNTVCWLLAIMLVSNFCAFAQSWQWGKSGGTSEAVQNPGSFGNEDARYVATDHDGNVYISSIASSALLFVDGNPKATFANGSLSIDGVLASFTCEGTYRWSKVIGGIGNDRIQGIGTDAAGNVYAAGTLTPAQLNDADPNYVHFDNDTILPASYNNVNTYKQRLFIVKYNSDGVLQWLRMPQREDISLTESLSQYTGKALCVDPDGNTYFLSFLGVGLQANGAYNVTGGTGLHVLKYDTNGDFVSGFKLPMEGSAGSLNEFKFYRNPNNGHFYVVGSVFLSIGQTVIIGGETMVHNKFLAAFDASGNHLWTRTNIGNAEWGQQNYDVTFDANNNLYLTGSTMYQTSEIGSQIDGFNGQLFDPPAQFTVDPFPFLVKLDANGNTLWQTNGSRGYSNGITVRGNEVTLVGNGTDLIWQSVNYTYPFASMSGGHPFLIRFNKETGTIIDANYLISYGNDFGTSVTSDQNGSYYMGGRISSNVTVNSTVLYNQGGQTDFFLAKFGTDNCTFLDVDTPAKPSMQPFPNPVIDKFQMGNLETINYTIFNLLGAKVSDGILEPNANINISTYTYGIYIIELQDGNSKQQFKIIKN